MVDDMRAILGLDDNSEDVLLSILIRQAQDAVLQRLFPYDQSQTEVPKRYESKVIQIAIYLYNKRGAEGQRYHHENNIMRGYESAHIPKSMLSDIAPMVGVPK